MLPGPRLDATFPTTRARLMFKCHTSCMRPSLETTGFHEREGAEHRHLQPKQPEKGVSLVAAPDKYHHQQDADAISVLSAHQADPLCVAFVNVGSVCQASPFFLVTFTREPYEEHHNEYSTENFHGYMRLGYRARGPPLFT